MVFVLLLPGFGVYEWFDQKLESNLKPIINVFFCRA